MNKYLTIFGSHSQYVNPEIKPNVSYCIQEDEVHYNPITNADRYFTLVALENGTFTFTPQNNNVISYSTDNGSTWTQGTSVTVSNGDKVMWKGTMTPSSSGIGNFDSTANFDVQGNAMSLLYGDNYIGQTNLTGKTYAFYHLFKNNTKVISAEKLSLPATILANSCYYGMFNGCTSLTTAPELPATTLTQACYCNMFLNCTSLVVPPSRLGTETAYMCCNSMFNRCTNLTTAPELPATTLASECYGFMFYGCTSLNYIKAMFTTTPINTYTNNWVSGVAVSGTFVKNAAAEWNVTGTTGIPNGWIVQTATE